MNYNQLHSITVFFNPVSLNVLYIGVLSLIFSKEKFKIQTDKVIFFSFHSFKYEFN